MDYKQLMFKSLDDRLERLSAHVARLKRQIEKGEIGGEAGRLWLAQYAKGVGVNLCCGDFPIGESLGIDIDPEKLAMDLWGQADHYFDALPPLDFVVTNYIECFSDTLGILRNWRMRLKPKGKFASVSANSDVYTNHMGPLKNRRRVHCFTTKTLPFYFEKAGYKVIKVETEGNELRILAERE